MVDKLDLMQRLRAGGRWAEAEAFKNTALSEFKAKGVKDASEAAWTATAERFLSRADSDPDEAPVREGDRLIDIDELERIVRSGGNPLATVCTTCLRQRLVEVFDKVATLERRLGRQVMRDEALAGIPVDVE